MKRVMSLIWFVVLFLLAISLSAEMQTSLTLYNNIFSLHTQSDDLLGLSDTWLYGGDFDIHLLVNPGLIFEDTFQADSKLDVYILKPYDTGDLNIIVKQAYIDLLFFDIIGLKAGFIQTDYGFNNNYFHPMNVSEFIPEFRSLYPDIYIGSNYMGRPGVPSIRLYMTFPEFIPGLTLSFDQGLIWFDYENFEKNYLLSSLSMVYGNFQASTVLGFTAESFDSDADAAKPVLGMNMSLGLPFKMLLFWEGVLRQESFRSYVKDGVVETEREDLFFNQSVRLETSQIEPYFKNTVLLYGEYFYYNEGFSPDQYSDIYNYLGSQGMNVMLLPAYYNLIISNRNFNHYLTLGMGYSTKQRVNFLYKAVAEFGSNIWQHYFILGKSYDNVTISGTFIYVPENEQKYQLIYNATNLLFYFQLAIDL